MICEICTNEAQKNLVICSEKCKQIRQALIDIERDYFPTHGCDNCWGDLHQGCSEQCKKEFQESLKFGTRLWKLVHSITGHKRQD